MSYAKLKRILPFICYAASLSGVALALQGKEYAIWFTMVPLYAGTALQMSGKKYRTDKRIAGVTAAICILLILAIVCILTISQ
ncbi:MAG: hypothetical protein LUE23_11540 [Lachnospiraceae bacterium]|nr:hypothetical protein [Lachnospiraceae bacterium]